MDMPSPVIATGVIRSEVPAAAFLAPQRRARDEPRDGDEVAVAGAGRIGRIAGRAGGLERRDRARQALAISEKADGLPHQISDAGHG